MIFKATPKLKSGITLAASVIYLAHAQAASATDYVFTVDPLAQRFAINPNIYGVSHLMTDGYTNITAQQVKDLNTPLVRYGGDLASTYNWTENADNHGTDYDFESILENGSTAGAYVDSIVSLAKTGGAQAMVTLPMMGYVANLGANDASTWSFSVKKYGAQTGAIGDAGDGIAAAGNPKFKAGAYIVNNPLDASVALNSTNNAASLMKHELGKWGPSNQGGVKYYIMDNEPGFWCDTHRDVHPNGTTMSEMLNDYKVNAAAARTADPNALIVGPEECNWATYFYSGADIQYANAHGWPSSSTFPDRKAHGGMDYIPWLLQNLHSASVSSGKQLLNVFSLHWYPQGDEDSSDDSAPTQTLRNQTTRSLWDPKYADPDLSAENGGPVKPALIPQMTSWINQYYPGLQKAITEYSWGDEANMNGATTQADLLGIFGKTGLNMACRWGIPSASTPTYQVIKMFRNYDGNGSGFGDISIGQMSPDPDNVSVFTAVRSTDNALTMVVVNKSTVAHSFTVNTLPGWIAQPAKIVRHIPYATIARYQVSAANPTTIQHLAGLTTVPAGGVISQQDTVPAQSVTLYVMPGNYYKYDFNTNTTEGWKLASGTGTVSVQTDPLGYDDTALLLQAPANTTTSTKYTSVSAPYPGLIPGTEIDLYFYVASGASVRPYVVCNNVTYYGAFATSTSDYATLDWTLPANLPGPVQQLGLQLAQAPGAPAASAYFDSICW